MNAPYPTGRLVVDCSHNAAAFLLAATGPKIEINGQAVKANWGPWPFDLPPGNYHVRVSTRYLGEMGPATIQAAVYPGQVTTVFYRTPAVVGMAGMIGFTPQKTKGMGGLVVVMVIVFVLAIVIMLTTLLGAGPDRVDHAVDLLGQ